MTKPIIHVVSMSGGKDSTATALLAIEQHGAGNCRFVFADTGHEHQITHDYLNYLRLELGVRIDTVRASFEQEIANKRIFIARDARTKRYYDREPRRDKSGNIVFRKTNTGLPELQMVWVKGKLDLEGVPRMRKVRGVKARWRNKAKRRALAVLHPTGNPYLDLCLWKGRFPSRKAQFCTEHLKTKPLVEYQMALMDQGFDVWSWQGIRRDESANRSDALEFEELSPSLFAMRPIVEWTAQQTVDFVLSHEVELNPLYKLGMNRVGCFPCINASKDDISESARRFPEEIERVAKWEKLVAQASKRGGASFFPNLDRNPDQRPTIHHVVQWAKTTRGGVQYDLIRATEELPACSSAYGLCE